jgi:hypothetical protein
MGFHAFKILPLPLKSSTVEYSGLTDLVIMLTERENMDSALKPAQTG